MNEPKMSAPKPLDLSPRGDDFFVGFGDVPAIDRRTMLLMSAALLGAGAAAGYGLAGAMRAPGPGRWDQSTVLDLPGLLIREPYPMLRTLAISDEIMTSALVCFNKCGVGPRLEAFDAEQVTVKGTLIRREGRAQIAVVNGPDWIRAGAELSDSDLARLTQIETRDLGAAVLKGEILDSKCYFGAMRPGQGKVHKACAALCIAGGIPPAFYARDARGRAQAFLLTTEEGEGVPAHKIIPYTADPVELAGRLVQVGDLIHFRADLSSLQRLENNLLR